MGYYFVVCFLVNDNHSVWVCSENKSEVHTEEDLYGFILFLAAFFFRVLSQTRAIMQEKN